MFILSQNECQIFALENGMISICSGTITAKTQGNIYLDIGKYPGKDLNDNSRAQRVLLEILLAKKNGKSTYIMPKE